MRVQLRVLRSALIAYRIAALGGLVPADHMAMLAMRSFAVARFGLARGVGDDGWGNAGRWRRISFGDRRVDAR
ncbi:hypothetical protein SBBP2_1090003 [Burkholderiales bacterium]|nr:hypothetical protein SBBP2_1090003 [Burkholderiales bacterium]